MSASRASHWLVGIEADISSQFSLSEMYAPPSEVELFFEIARQ